MKYYIISLCVFQVNLSPALGNDCDIDQIVKKPMLHDMFDLLGLPMCNTGLSLFTVWSNSRHEKFPNDRSSLENEDGENENGRPKALSGRKGANSSALSVAAVASRWKRKQQKNHNATQSTSIQSTRKKGTCLQVVTRYSLPGSSGAISSCNQVFSGRKSMAQTSSTKTPTRHSSINKNIAHNSYSSTVLASSVDDDYHKPINSQNSHSSDGTSRCYNPLLTEHGKNQIHGFRGQNKYPPPMLWGNGRDWRSPPAGEGNWVRLFPLRPTTQCTMQEPQKIPTVMHGDTEVKNVVSAVHKYSKVARDIFKCNPTFSDESFSTIMKQTLGMISEVWLPSK
jgi:hypothetical protein